MSKNNKNNKSSAPTEPLKGTVKFFDESKGFGFIKQAAGPDIFVHATGVIDTRFEPLLSERDEVEYDIREGKKGPQAYNVKVISE